jgi:hypothetical protein
VAIQSDDRRNSVRYLLHGQMIVVISLASQVAIAADHFCLRIHNRRFILGGNGHTSN